MPPLRTHLLAAALLGLGPTPLTAQTALQVQALAAESLQGLAGAQVTVDGRARGVTDAGGTLRIDSLSGGRHTLEIALGGRIPRGFRLQLQAGEERELVAMLQPLGTVLPRLTGYARRRSSSFAIESFYRRAQNHVMGRFVTRAQMDQLAPVVFTDLFRGMPGVQLIPTARGWVLASARRVAFSRPSVDGSGTTDECRPIYFVDGMPFHISGSPDLELSAADVEGIEVYMGNVPAQWGGSKAMCGVVVVWTRERAGAG